jgi:hypothetical protein
VRNNLACFIDTFINCKSSLLGLIISTALKERGLDIQGNAKALTTRLIEYEEKR